MKEEWRPVVGFEMFYEVSDAGRVRKRLTHQLLEALLDTKGVPKVRLEGLARKSRLVKIGVVVLEAFVGPKPAGMEMRHFPLRDPTCNYLENLSWATRSRNQRDRAIHGTTTKQIQRRRLRTASKRSDA